MNVVFYFRVEIRVQFRHVPGNLYKRSLGMDLDRATNELLIRVQPDEAIYLKINNKIPGLGMRLDRSKFNLHYAARYESEYFYFIVFIFSLYIFLMINIENLQLGLLLLFELCSKKLWELL